MAKTPVKKAAVKKAPAAKPVVKAAPAAKKAPVAKKPVAKKAAVKPAVAPETKIVMQAPAACPSSCGCGCKCKCGKFGRFVKKLIVFLVIFALGFAAAQFCDGGRHGFRKGPHMPKVTFIEGCLDTSKVACPEMAEKIAAIDADNNGCITAEEFKAAKKEMRGKMKHGKKFGHRGAGKCNDCGCNKNND